MQPSPTTPAPPAEQVEPVKGWTPGPWGIGKPSVHVSVGPDGGAQSVAVVLFRGDDGWPSGGLYPSLVEAAERDANARLIAASPALYEALLLAEIKLSRYMEVHLPDRSYVGGLAAEYRACLATIRAALTSARSPQQAPAAAHQPQEG